jgi:hypothetical protein
MIKLEKRQLTREQQLERHQYIIARLAEAQKITDQALLPDMPLEQRFINARQTIDAMNIDSAILSMFASFLDEIHQAFSCDAISHMIMLNLVTSIKNGELIKFLTKDDKIVKP